MQHGFIWLEQFVDKLLVKHGVDTNEVEELFGNTPKITRMLRGSIPGEDVYRALGQSHSGRYLVVIFIRKRSGATLVVSARDMDEKERRNYARK